MYAIAVKKTNRSSWTMESRVYDDREKCDAVISVLLLENYKVQRVFFDPE